MLSQMNRIYRPILKTHRQATFVVLLLPTLYYHAICRQNASGIRLHTAERDSLSYCSGIRAVCCLLFACLHMNSGLAGIKYLHVHMYVALESWKLIGRKQLCPHPRGSKCSNRGRDMCTHACRLIKLLPLDPTVGMRRKQL